MCTIYVTHEPGQNTLVPSYKTTLEITQTLEVPVVRLDSYIEAHRIGRVSMIKIDTEGFELPILRGLTRYFETTSSSPGSYLRDCAARISLDGNPSFRACRPYGCLRIYLAI